MNTSSWPIFFGIVAVIAAAFWYDASNASATAPVATSANAAVR